jgi:hypothetical protein
MSQGGVHRVGREITTLSTYPDCTTASISPMTTVLKQHAKAKDAAATARAPHRTRASFTSMATGLIKLSPDFIDAVRAVAPRTRRRKLPVLLAIAAFAFVAWGVFTSNGRQWFGTAARRIWEGTHVSEAAASTGSNARSASIAPLAPPPAVVSPASVPAASAPSPPPTPAPPAVQGEASPTVANVPVNDPQANAGGAAITPPNAPLGSTAAVPKPSKAKQTRKQHRHTPR